MDELAFKPVMSLKNISSRMPRRNAVRMKIVRSFKDRRRIHAVGFRQENGEMKIESFFQTRQDAERAVRQRGMGYTILTGYL
jgi:hypothetical protein